MSEIRSIGDVFTIARDRDAEFFDPGKGFPLIWYRGHADAGWELQPKVLRSWFIERVEESEILNPEPCKLAVRERTINRQFRRMAASLLPIQLSIAHLYFLMQHHGFPTRLLDWTGNPLVALFFAVSELADRDGKLFVINPKRLIPRNADPSNPIYPFDVVNVRHALIEQVTRSVFGEAPYFDNPFILPVLPDLTAGRLLQQASCFTLHVPMPAQATGGEATLKEPINQITGFVEYVIPKEVKKDILIDLRRVGINRATLFPDLDNVSREIAAAWDLCECPVPKMAGKNRDVSAIATQPAI